ncbi:RDD family protein [Candidatus Poriferisocius sp.]|uniref:RDD family protein n=1 Tax=Candidatus Poriferisocius sp. TaxID=3101276 RepID=UPI003B01B2EA
MSVSSWDPDPTGRHQYRWWDGERWTDQVADNGVQRVDSLSDTESKLPHKGRPENAPASSITNRSLSPAETGDPSTMLASRGQRVGAFFLELLMSIVTLGIGYLIWSLIVYSRGQTPGKQLLNMKVVSLEQRQAASWGSMFVREWILKGIIIVILTTTTAVGGSAWLLLNLIIMLTSDTNQTIWDKILKTVVVNDPDGVFNSQRGWQ